METPDKIYLGIDELDSGYVYNLSLENNGHAEYIRKDVLLEWAKEKQNESLTIVADDIWQELIDKLNSI